MDIESRHSDICLHSPNSSKDHNETVTIDGLQLAIRHTPDSNHGKERIHYSHIKNLQCSSLVVLLELYNKQIFSPSWKHSIIVPIKIVETHHL